VTSAYPYVGIFVLNITEQVSDCMAVRANVIPLRNFRSYLSIWSELPKKMDEENVLFRFRECLGFSDALTAIFVEAILTVLLGPLVWAFQLPFQNI